MVLLPDGLKALKDVAKKTGFVLEGAYLNLDGGFDSTRNRKMIFNAGMIPNIKENPRNLRGCPETKSLKDNILCYILGKTKIGITG